MLDSLDTLISFALIMLIVSLLITIAVQMMAALLNLRGLNLVNGLTNTLETILPGTEDQAKKFIAHILQSPMISDSCSKWLPNFWRRATAVRSDEVFDAIHRIATGRLDAPADFQQYALNLLVALGVDEHSLKSAAAATGKTATGIVDTATGLISKVPDPALQAQLTTMVDNVQAQLTAYATAEADRILKSAQTTAATIDNAFTKFQYWSDICQERVQQWFAMHTRILTVIFAIAFTLWLQLDSVELFKMVSTNRTVRDKLVAQATTTAAHAEKILSDSKSVLHEAFASFRDRQTDPGIQVALKAVTVETSDTRGSLVKKVKAALANNQDKEKNLTDELDVIINETASKRLNTQAGDFTAMKSELDQTGFDLFPKGKKWRWGDQWHSKLTDHLLGMLFSAALLSLGAPFWYNILKSLTSLRSTVAKNISEEQKQARQQSEPSSAARTPPTV